MRRWSRRPSQVHGGKRGWRGALRLGCARRPLESFTLFSRVMSEEGVCVTGGGQGLGGIAKLREKGSHTGGRRPGWEQGPTRALAQRVASGAAR